MWIKKFINFKESLVIDVKDMEFDINESLNVWFDSLLASINAQPVDIYTALKLARNANIDLENLDKDSSFITTLSDNGLKKSNMEITSDYETFLKTPCRFMFIYDKKASNLDNPYYLLLQVYNGVLNKWEVTNIYKINDSIKKFYDQLSSKTIEIIDGTDRFIYETGNGNEWTLKSVKETDIYKRNFDKEDLEKIIQDRKVKVNII
jgi:hypothetical protein